MWLKNLRRAPRQCPGGDAGFTLIEAVASLAIATVMLTAIAYATVGGARGSTEARINQQAADVLESAMEAARTQSYGSLVMYTGDANLTTAKDSRLLSTGCPTAGSMCLSVPDPTGSGSVKEDLITSAVAGYQANHIQTVSKGDNNVTFTTATYITTPTEETKADYKRITIYVTWRVYGQTHTRVASTYVTETQRGLPLPRFTLSVANKSSLINFANPGQTVKTGVTLLNQGARDAFDISASDNTLNWHYYVDSTTAGTPGQYDPDTTIDVPLVDNDTDTIPDTGLMDTGTSITIWMIGTVPASATDGQVFSVTITGTSVAQPNLGPGTSTQSQTFTVTSQFLITSTPTPSASSSTTAPATTPPVTTPPVTTAPATTPPACAKQGTSATTGDQYWLHSATGGATTTMDKNQPTSTSLITKTLSSTTASFDKNDNYNPKPPAEWDMLIPTGTSATYSGTMTIDFWAKPTSGLTTDPVGLSAKVGLGVIGTGNKYTWTNETNSTGVAGPVTGCGSWQEFVIQVGIKQFTPVNGNYLQVLLFDTGGSSVDISYNSTTNPATVTWQHT